MGFSDEVGLLFKLKADGSQAIGEIGKFRGAVKGELKGIAEDFASSAGGAGKFAASLGPVGLALGATAGVLAGVGAGLTATIVKAVELGSRFNDLSLQTGLSVETLSGLESQLKQSGTSAESLGNAVLFMHKNLGAATEGSKEMQAAFRAAGIKDFDAALRDTDGTLRTVIKSLGELTSEGERDRLGTELLGRGYKELRVFIADTGGDIEETLRRACEAGLLMSGEVAGNLDALGDAWDRLGNKTSIMGANFAGTVAPEITKALDDINAALTGNLDSWASWSQGMAYWIARTRGTMEGAAKWWKGDTWSPQELGKAIGQGADAAELGMMTDWLWNKVKPPQAKSPGGGGSGSRGGGRKGGGGADKAAQGRLKDIQLDQSELDANFHRESAALERDYQLRLDTLAQFTEQELALLDEWLKEKRAVFDREEKEVSRSTKGEEERERKLREIQAKRTSAQDEYESKRNAALDKQAEEERKVADAKAEGLAKIEDASAQRRIASIEHAAEFEVKLESEAASEIGKIRLEMHDRAVDLLKRKLDGEREGSAEFQRIQKEIGAMEVERAAIAEETAHRVAMAKKAEVEAERERLEALRRLRAQAVAEQLEAERLEIEVGAAGDRFPTRSERIDTIRARAANDRSLEETRHQAALDELKNQRAEMLAKAKNFDEFLEIETSYHTRREAEARRHAAQMQEINQGQRKTEDEESPFKAFKDLWGEFKNNAENTNDTISDSVGQMSESVVGSLQNMKGALEQGIKSWILYGGSLGQAIKKAAAEELGSVAARAAIKGAEMAAYALASLAFGDFGSAAKFAAASAAFFALAATTGVAARALAKSAGMTGGGGSAAGDTAASTSRQNGRDANQQDDRAIHEARRGGSPDPKVPTFHVVIHDNVKTEPGMFRDRVVEVIEGDSRAHTAVARAWTTAYNYNGRTRSTIMREMGYAISD